LSDKVKAVLARAKTDQSVADQLKAFVSKHRHQGGSSQEATSDSLQAASNDSSQTSSDSKTDIDKAFDKLTAGNAAQDPAASSQDGAQTGDVSTSVTVNAQSGSTETIVNGQGWSYADFKSGNFEEITQYSSQTGEYDVTYTLTDAAAASATASSNSGAASASAAEAQSDPITFGWTSPTGSFSGTVTLTAGAAASATASSGAGVTSASAAEVQSSSVTLASNLKTGAFSIIRSQTTAASATAQIKQATSSFSRTA
jgi:hypothetical protein